LKGINSGELGANTRGPSCVFQLACRAEEYPYLRRRI